MSTVATAVPFWNTMTYRRFAGAIALSVALLCLFSLLAFAEESITGQTAALERPLVAATVCVGLAHFVIGFAYMVTSRSMQSSRSRFGIVVALGVGVALCWLFALAGGADASPRIPVVLVGLYFLVHQFRDERMFFRQYGGAPSTGRDRGYVALLALGLFFGMAATWYGLTVALRPESSNVAWMYPSPSFDNASYLLALIGPTALLASGCWACLRTVRHRTASTVRELLQQDQALWMVYLTIPLFAFAALPFGGQGYSIVLLHVAAWWVFISFGLADPARPAGMGKVSVSSWLRRSQAGFQTLHVGLALLVLIAMFAWAYLYDAAPDHPLTWLAEPENFYYWTILHVTLSFVPKGTPSGTA